MGLVAYRRAAEFFVDGFSAAARTGENGLFHFLFLAGRDFRLLVLDQVLR